jgi:hypothetical protein
MDGGPRWRFQVRGTDLVLTHGGSTLTLVEALPDDGLRYAIDDLVAPHMVFVLRDGRRAHWRGDEVEIDGAKYRVEGAAEVRVGSGAR